MYECMFVETAKLKNLSVIRPRTDLSMNANEASRGRMRMQVLHVGELLGAVRRMPRAVRRCLRAFHRTLSIEKN